MTISSDSTSIFSLPDQVAPLKLIVQPGTDELAEKINHYLTQWSEQSGRQDEPFLIKGECPRFASGDGKGLLKSSIRGDDLFILVDVGNYSCTYNIFGHTNCMSPDDHFQDLKRTIQAVGGKAHRINVIMPILFGGRQHRRNYRESLDCACALQELANMGVSNIITFDAHDARVQNAVPLMGFDNIIPAYQALKALFRAFPDIQPDAEHLMIISPDEGAMHRNMYYASNLGVELGMFYKRRDYSRVVNGRNPIVAHEYLGNAVDGKDIFIADDIISSGESMLDTARELKKRNAGRVFVYATYAIFTNGLDAYDKAYADGTFTGVFGTNLTYCSPELLSRPWFHQVDVSKYIAYIIAALNHDVSVSLLMDSHERIMKLIEKHNQK